MSDVLDYYVQQASAARFASADFSSLQLEAVCDLQRLGLPTKALEDWKYLNLTAFYGQQFAFDAGQALRDTQLELPQNIDMLRRQGLIVEPIASMMSTQADLIAPYLGKIMQHEHGLLALNSAMLSAGFVIYVPAGLCVEEPIVVNHVSSQDHHAAYVRHLIIAEAGSQVSVIENYTGVTGSVYLTNSVTEVAVHARANVTHYKIQCESHESFHLGHVFVQQEESSRFASHCVSLGGQLARSDLTISLQEQQAECLLNGLYLPGNLQQMDHHTRVNHQVAHCTSSQDYKGILKGRSKAVFNGQVMVVAGAQKTTANQQNKNLLLSVDAEIDTKPQLEIYADDVVCTHGATVGQLDEDAVFYLQSRGLGAEEVLQYLIQAFIAHNVQLIDNLEVRQRVLQLINEKNHKG